MHTASPLKKNNVTVIGNIESERAMIFAHGFGIDQTTWHEVSAAFLQDYKVILYDNVGAGKSDPEAFSPLKYNNLKTYANDLIDICETLQVNDAVMVGHSVSGMISMLACIKAPQYFSKLIMIGASPRYLNDDDYFGGFEQNDLDALYQAMNTNYQAWVSGFAPLAMRNPDNPRLAEQFAAILNSIRPDIAQSVARVIFQSDYRSELHRLKKPTLLIHARRDIAVPDYVADYLHEHIADSQLNVIDASGHFPHMSAPDQVISAIKNFI